MSCTIRRSRLRRPRLVWISACWCVLAIGPAYGQFGGGEGDIGGGCGGFWPAGSLHSEFADVTLEGPRELDPDTPAVIDEARFVPEQLRKPLTWDVVDLPLEELATEFSTRVGLPVLIDKTALKDVGIPLDEPMTASINDVPAYLLLERVLRGLGLTWVIDDDIVRITTTEIAEEWTETTVYPVGDLLQSGCTMQSLIDTLQSETDAEWEDIDGVGGTVSQAGRTLVLRQTQRAHREIAGILEALRHPRRQTIVGDSALREAIEEKLDQTIESVDFEDVPLEDAVAHLAEEAGIPVAIDETALTGYGIKLDKPVSLHLENRPARTMFRLILSPLGLTTINRDAVLTVTTTEIAEEGMLTFVYEVSDLCRTQEQTNTLIDVLQSDTDGSWEDIDGIGGSISMPRVGTLVLRQTERVHREIAGILEQLRETLGDETLADPATPDDDQVETRYYHLPKDQARELAVTIPGLIEQGTWQGWNTNGEAVGRITTISADPELYPVSQGKETTVAQLPRAILVVRHQRGVLKKIERFLAEMSVDSRDGGGGLGGGGLGGGGGGGFGGGGGGGFGGGGFGGGGFGGGFGCSGGHSISEHDWGELATSRSTLPASTDLRSPTLMASIIEPKRGTSLQLGCSTECFDERRRMAALD
jgi:hypothetical protein